MLRTYSYACMGSNGVFAFVEMVSTDSVNWLPPRIRDRWPQCPVRLSAIQQMPHRLASTTSVFQVENINNNKAAKSELQGSYKGGLINISYRKENKYFRKFLFIFQHSAPLSSIHLTQWCSNFFEPSEKYFFWIVCGSNNQLIRFKFLPANPFTMYGE